MLLLYYMILFILESSTFFSVSHDYVTVTVKYITNISYFVTCMTVTYDIILHLFFFFKSSIYYIRYIGSLWQLLCNCIHSDQNYMKKKNEKVKTENKRNANCF